MKIFGIAFVILIGMVSSAFAGVTLKAKGSALAAPLFFKWIEERREDPANAKVYYEAKDSFAGVDEALGHGSDFTVTDTILTPEEADHVKGRMILNLPVALEAVAITYNLPGIPAGLKLTPSVLSDIFMGTLKNWNNSAIQELNPGVKLPDMDIRVVHREEESSLHDLFPAFLAKENPKWILNRVKEKKLHWPSGENVKGNDKVMEKMRLWPGTIAAVDLTYAIRKKLPVAALRNTAGEFVTPSVESLEATASDFPSLPEEFQVNLDRSRAHQAYPLCAFTYLLVYQDHKRVYHDAKRGEALVDFLNWIYSDGQKTEESLGYGPLPEAFIAQIKERVQTIKY